MDRAKATIAELTEAAAQQAAEIEAAKTEAVNEALAAYIDGQARQTANRRGADFTLMLYDEQGDDVATYEWEDALLKEVTAFLSDLAWDEHPEAVTASCWMADAYDGPDDPKPPVFTAGRLTPPREEPSTIGVERQIREEDGFASWRVTLTYAAHLAVNKAGGEAANLANGHWATPAGAWRAAKRIRELVGLS